MKKKKNRFWLFIFSLWPGAGHMYMGFMKMGLSLTLGFMLLIMIVSITGSGAFGVLPFTLYIYSFFHANNIGGLDDESFAAMEDVYLFGLDGIGNRQVKIDQKGKKAVAVVFIVIGLYMLWNVAFEVLRGFLGWENPVLKAVYYIMRDDVPRVVIAIAIIWFGTVLLRGKKGVTEVTDDNRNEQMKQITQKDDANPEEHI